MKGSKVPKYIFSLVEVVFSFSDGSQHAESFTAADSSLKSTVDDYAKELLEELNEDSDDKVELEGYEVDWFDGDFADPDDFADLNEYGAYAENVEHYGIAYHLRYEDVGEHNFDDEYNGEWDSAEEFAKNLIDSCYEIPSELASYIDYEKWTRDIMYDYSEYEDSSGMVHIFRR